MTYQRNDSASGDSGANREDLEREILGEGPSLTVDEVVDRFGSSRASF